MTWSASMWFFLTSLFIATPAKCTLQALAIKQEINNFNDSIPIAIHSYMDLVKNSKVFVDNSLLIEEIFYYRGQHALLILGPNTWGKSINLDMIKTFYDEQYEHKESRDRLFKKGEIVSDDGRVEKLKNPLLITTRHPEFVEEYMGNVTVGYVSFKDITSENFTVVQQQIALAFKKEFQRHGISFCDRYELNFLFRRLAERDKSKRIMLILEDYDKPLLNVLSRCDFKNTMELFEILKNQIHRTVNTVGGVFLNLAKEVQLGGIFTTGKFRLKYDYDNEYESYYSEINFNEKSDSIGDYFGITEQNVKRLFELHKIGNKLSRQAIKWYRYQRDNLTFYNPLSIAKFLKKQKLATYCKQNQNKELIRNVIHSQPKLINTLLSTISKNLVTVQENLILEFEYKPVHSIGQIFYNVNETKCTPKIYDEKKFFTYLLKDGYFTRVEDTSQAKLANNEMAFEISQYILSYYTKEHKIDKELLKNAVIAFLTLIKKQTDDQQITLQESLTALYNLAYINDNEYKQSIRSILNCVLLSMQHELKFEMDIYYNNILGPDYVTVNEETGRGVVIQLCHNSSAHEALRLAEKYVNVFQNFTFVNKKKFIGINISPEKTIQVLEKII